MPPQLIQRVIVHRIRGQVAVLGIALQQALPFQKTAHALRDGERQLGEFLGGWYLDPAKPGCCIGMIDIHPIQEQHVKWMLRLRALPKRWIRVTAQQGMKTFDQALYELYNAGEITYDDALHHADSANEVRLMVKLKDGEVDADTALSGISLVDSE
jgi:hypothetical protein